MIYTILTIRVIYIVRVVRGAFTDLGAFSGQIVQFVSGMWVRASKTPLWTQTVTFSDPVYPCAYLRSQALGLRILRIFDIWSIIGARAALHHIGLCELMLSSFFSENGICSHLGSGLFKFCSVSDFRCNSGLRRRELTLETCILLPNVVHLSLKDSDSLTRLVHCRPRLDSRMKVVRARLEKTDPRKFLFSCASLAE